MPSDITVAHIVPALFGTSGCWGGAERYVWELACNMASKVPTSLISFGARRESYREGELRVEIFPLRRTLGNNRFNPLSFQFLKALRPATAIHCHQKHLFISSLTALWGRVSRRNVFVTDYGGGGMDISNWIDTSAWYRGELFLSRYAQKLENRWSRQVVVYGGVNTDRFVPSDLERSAVLFVGRILPHKGIDLLIRATPPPGAPRDCGAQLRPRVLFPPEEPLPWKTGALSQ